MCDNQGMKFKMGLVIGLVVGFLLGARAGRERYEQILATYNKVRSNEQVRGAADIAERSTRKTRAAAGRGLVSVADTVREKSAT